jgi:amino acid transporter
MTYGGFLYNVFLLLHIGAVVVGFGSSFVYPFFGARARKLGPTAPKEAFALSDASLAASHVLTTPVIYAAGAFGIILVLLSEGVFKFSQLWISIAFLLFIAAACIAGFLHNPNLKAMNALSEKIANGDVTPSPGGPPREVAELQERGQKAGAFGGVLHLLWLLLMIDMIWKPGLG